MEWFVLEARWPRQALLSVTPASDIKRDRRVRKASACPVSSDHVMPDGGVTDGCWVLRASQTHFTEVAKVADEVPEERERKWLICIHSPAWLFGEGEAVDERSLYCLHDRI